MVEKTPTSWSTFGYDLAGNRIKLKFGSSGFNTYTWDVEQRLTKIRLASNNIVTLAYNGDHQRVSRQDSAATVKHVWAGQNLLMETTGAGATQAVYTQTGDVYGRLVSQRRGSTTNYVHTDFMGSVTQLTSSAQAITDSYQYGAFGDTKSSTGTTINPHQYIGALGYYRDPAPNTAFNYVRRRWLVPPRGMWMSRDPSGLDGGDWNLYRYVGNQPLEAVDPSGLIVRLVPRKAQSTNRKLIGIEQRALEAIFQALCPQAHARSDIGGVLHIRADEDFCKSSIVTNYFFSWCGFSLNTYTLPRGCSTSPFPESCCCVCDAVNSPKVFKVRFWEPGEKARWTKGGGVGAAGGTDRPPDPDDPESIKGNVVVSRITPVGGTTMGTGDTSFPQGNRVRNPPFITLGHELCGHALHITDATFQHPETDLFTGTAKDKAIIIENRIRAEHSKAEDNYGVAGVPFWYGWLTAQFARRKGPAPPPLAQMLLWPEEKRAAYIYNIICHQSAAQLPHLP